MRKLFPTLPFASYHKKCPVGNSGILTDMCFYFKYIHGEDFYASVDESDLYTAIDAVKESLYREISKSKDRKQTLFKREATSVKKMLKGLSKRNPFTSKY